MMFALQERAYVTGLTAANLVVDSLGQGRPANILPGERLKGSRKPHCQPNIMLRPCCDMRCPA